MESKNGTMRLDKFLKVSRILKRRTVANEACGAGKAQINGKAAKPGHSVKPGDIITLTMGGVSQSFQITRITATAKKDEAKEMYAPLEESIIQ